VCRSRIWAQQCKITAATQFRGALPSPELLQTRRPPSSELETGLQPTAAGPPGAVPRAMVEHTPVLIHYHGFSVDLACCYCYCADGHCCGCSYDSATAPVAVFRLARCVHTVLGPSLINFLTHLPSCHVSMYFHSFESPPYISLMDSNDEAVTKFPQFTSFEENPFRLLVDGERDATKGIPTCIPMGLRVLRDALPQCLRILPPSIL